MIDSWAFDRYAENGSDIKNYARALSLPFLWKKIA